MQSSSESSGGAARTAALPTGRGDLRTRLVWVTVFRTVATLLLFGVLAARLLAKLPADLSSRDSLAFTTQGAVFLLSAIYGVWLRWGRYERQLAAVQIIGDVVIAAGVVLLTGGAESPFSFLFLLAILAGAILLAHVGAIGAAVGSATLYTGLVLAVQFRLLDPAIGAEPLSQRSLLFAVTSNLLSQSLIAVLAAYLARQLLATGGRLSQREADLRQLAELQRQILASMPSGLLTCTAAGELVYINEAGRNILGLTESGSGAQTAHALITEAKRIRPGERRVEVQLESPSGPRVLGIGVSELSGETGSLLVVFQDLTDLRTAESALRRSDQLASLGRLSAQLAHEIRNPLASMRGSAQMLAADMPRDSSSEKLAKILIRESDRLEGLVESFLRFARPQPPAFARVRLDTLVADTADLLAQDPIARSVHVSRQLEPVELQGDADQLRQVVVNLLRNAFEAVGPDGRVRLVVEPGSAQAALRVWDSAGKISPADMSRLFEPFFTTRQGGTGLGLSTAQSIVSAHGGWIEVKSSPREGTEFVVRLPLMQAGAQAASA